MFAASLDKFMRSALVQEQKLHWWCYALATRPDLQRNGFGTALVNVGYQKASLFQFRGTNRSLIF